MLNDENGHEGPGMVTPADSSDDTKAKAPIRRNPRAARLLRMLSSPVGGELSSVELRGSVGCSNVSALVGRVNKAHGHIIKTVERRMPDRDGRAIWLGFYVIDPGPCAELASAALAFHEVVS